MNESFLSVVIPTFNERHKSNKQESNKFIRLLATSLFILLKEKKSWKT